MASQSLQSLHNPAAAWGADGRRSSREERRKHPKAAGLVHVPASSQSLKPQLTPLLPIATVHRRSALRSADGRQLEAPLRSAPKPRLHQVSAPASAQEASTQQLPVTWSNPKGSVLAEVVEGLVWSADRPFVWNKIDVGGRMAVVKLRDGSLWVHSPVELEPSLRAAVDALGPVGHIVSPNFEHCKYAQQWIDAYPNAKSYACPGLAELRPDIKYKEVVGISNKTPANWNDEFDVTFFDCERNPFNGKPFFNEVLFFHKPSRTLFVTDLWWNYPTDVPLGTSLWKFGMDKVYLPFYKQFMVVDRPQFSRLMKRVLTWEWEVLVPCHGKTVFTNGKKVFEEHFSGLV